MPIYTSMYICLGNYPSALLQSTAVLEMGSGGVRVARCWLCDPLRHAPLAIVAGLCGWCVLSALRPTGGALLLALGWAFGMLSCHEYGDISRRLELRACAGTKACLRLGWRKRTTVCVGGDLTGGTSVLFTQLGDLTRWEFLADAAGFTCK